MKKTVLFVLIFSLLLAAYAGAGAETAAEDKTEASAFIVPVMGDIDRGLTVYIRRSLEQADAAGADLVIFEINTFGGLVESALQIATLIGAANQKTIAYIPSLPESTGVSWSAGALISFACSSIYMAPGTSIGAAAPVYTGTDGPQAAEEKTVSAVRAQMAALAEKNGYPRAAALAMVDKDIELLEVRTAGSTRLIQSSDLETEKKHAADAGDDFELVKTVSAEGKLLAFTAMEMQNYGISSGTPETRDDLLNMLGISSKDYITAETSAPDQLVSILTGGILTALLIMTGLVALYMEITSPGFGIPGTLAIIIFAVLFLSNSMLGRVGSLEILMFIAGIALLAVEIFLIPGFGAAGISGFLLIAAALLLSQQDFIIPEFSWQKELLKQNLLNVGAGVLGSILLIFILFQFFPRSRLFGRLILKTSMTSDEGFTVQEAAVLGPSAGDRGTAVTVLRPSGKAEFDGLSYPVETDGEFISAGTPVEVTAVNSNRIIVRGV